MTIDERLKFLLESTESLHSSIQQLHETVATHAGIVSAHTEQLKIDADNIRRLANIAFAHEQRLDHFEKRLDDLKGTE
jgi:hypothetical protein